MAVARFHQKSGGKLYNEITTPEGIQRFFIKYDISVLKKFMKKSVMLNNIL